MGITKAATDKEIKKAYLKRCIAGEFKHPDKGGDPEKFKRLNEAHDTLSNADKREIYDKYGE